MAGGVVVVGGGIAGVAAARAVHDAGLQVVVRERADHVGGRMATPLIDGRHVDIGAAYLTVESDRFAAQVSDWSDRGLARPWTDTFHVATPDGLAGTSSGPIRFAAPAGLASLVADVAAGLAVEHELRVVAVGPGPSVDGEPVDAVVLAMPGPQALAVLDPDLTVETRISDRRWEPCLALVATWGQRCWRMLDGAFVEDSPVLTWVADDGRRRGDDAPVLVAHSDPVLAAAHLDDPETAGPAMVDELCRVLGIDTAPDAWQVLPWRHAKPAEPVEQPFHLGPARVALCGDGWHGRSRIESAYLSGHAAGRAVVRLLGG